MIRDNPIVYSRLLKDWYYVTMGFFAWSLHRGARVRWAFKNRSKDIVLGDRIDIGRLREEIAHVATLRYTAEEILWLKRRYGVQAKDGFLTDEYLDMLGSAPLSEIEIERVQTPNGPGFRIEPHGLWHEGMDWETFILPIITFLNGEWVMKQHGVTREQLHKEALRRHAAKIERLRQYPTLRYGSFGLRRQLDYVLSRKIDEMDIEQIPDQLAGISNVKLAMEEDKPVIGTFAHQGPMIYSGLCEDTDEAIRASHMRFFDDWFRVFGPRWSTAVTETYGSKAFYEDFGAARAAAWNVYKQDSGDPAAEAEKLETWLLGQGVNPRGKIYNPTDGLTVDTMIGLHVGFGHRFKAVVPGWGTTRTNDTGLPTYGSFVVKAVEANGRSLVKLSNNLNKASGDPAQVERFKKIFGYDSTFRQECVV